MNPQFWSFRVFAALWGILLAPLVPAAALPGDFAAQLPADTLACVGWSKPLSAETVQMLDAVPRLLTALDVEPGVADRAGQAARLLSIVGRADGTVALLGVESGEAGLTVALQATIEAGVRTPTLVEGLRALLGGDRAAERISAVEIDGVTFQRIEAWPELLWAGHQGRFLLASSRELAAALLREQPIDPSLAGDDLFQSCRDKIGSVAEGQWKFSAYVNLTRLTATVKRLLGEKLPPKTNDLLRELGVDGLRAVYLRTDRTADGPVSRLLLRTAGPRTGLLKIWDQQPLSEDDLRLVPQDASWAVVSNWDLAASWQEARRVVEALDPNAAAQLDGLLAMASATVGFSPTDDLLPALGDTWIVYDAPDHGGVLLTGAVLVAEVRQPEALRGTFGRLLNFVRPLLAAGGLTLSSRQATYRGHTIHYLVAAGRPIPLAPAAAFIGDRVICGLTPQPVKLALDQADPATRHGSILDHPDVERLATVLPERMQRFSYADTPTMVRSVYPLVHLLRTAFGSVVAGEENVPALGDLPTLPEFVADTHSTVVTCTADAEGVVYRCDGRVIVGTGSLGSVATVGLLTSILVPSLSRARELAKRAVSEANLRGIGQGLHIYANDHDGRFPETLAELVEVGCITREMLSSPRDAQGAVSYVYLSGQGLSDDSRNVVAYERIIGDEGTNVLFLDGHVEWMTLTDFERALRATYERLGRPVELPSELQR